VKNRPQAHAVSFHAALFSIVVVGLFGQDRVTTGSIFKGDPTEQDGGASHPQWHPGYQVPTRQPLVVREPKLDSELIELMKKADRIPVLITLNKHPQRAIAERVRGMHNLRLEVARGRYKRISERAALTGESMEDAHKEIDEIERRIATDIYAALEMELRPTLDTFNAKLHGLGAKDVRTFEHFSAFSADIPAAAIETLVSDPALEMIRRADSEVRMQIAQSVPAIGTTTFWSNNLRGNGQTVAILDTGATPNHPAFAGRVEAYRNVPFNALNCLFGDNPSTGLDYHGHGTHVAGIIMSQGTPVFPGHLGVAPGVSRLLSVKVLCRTNEGPFQPSNELDIISGLHILLDANFAKVINYSGGKPTNMDDDTLARSFDEAADDNFGSVIVAAGNLDPRKAFSNRIHSPATAYNVISVANADTNRPIPIVNPASSVGPTVGDRRKPDIAAPGTQIYSTNANHLGFLGFDQTFGLLFVPQSGTSMAAPHVAGATALLRQRGVVDPKAIKAILLNSASALNWDNAAGWGLINLDAAYRESTNSHYVSSSLTSRLGSTPFRLYRSTMPAPVKSTLVWNRFVQGAFSTVSALDLYLYDRSTGSKAFDETFNNVKRVYATQPGNYVLKVSTPSVLFGHPYQTEPFALANSVPNFVPTAGPTLTMNCPSPGTVTAGATVTIQCTVTNSGDVDAFGVGAVLNYQGLSGAPVVGFGNLAPGASATRSFSAIAPQPGTYSLLGLAGTISYDETFETSTTLSFTSTSVGGGGVLPSAGLRFVPLPPCRLMETRAEYNFEGRTGAFGPPFVKSGETRTLTPANSNVCQIPTNARAYVLNVTVIPRGGVDFVTLWPSGESRPDFWSVRSPDGQIVANQAIVKSGSGSINLYASNDTDFLIDISGYFADALSQQVNLVYYPLTPCRVIETRSEYRSPAGPFGPPSMATRETRRFRFPTSPHCTIPAGATAYSATLTVVPPQPLPYMTLWPAGGSQPNVSSINSFNGRVLANNVIIPASLDGSIDVFAFDNTDFLVDINGYFAPDNGQSGLYYFPVRQCRASDSTVTGGAYPDDSTRTVGVPTAGNCTGIPATARGYVVNVTALPNGSPMPFITVYPTGQPRPNASVLNAFQGQVVTNSTIVPAGTNGALDVYAFRRTHVVVEISGYFGR